MVKVFVDDPLNCLKSLEDSRIYCFGAGKRFREFVILIKNLDIEGVIDNYQSENNDIITVDENSFHVLSLDDYISRASERDVLIITSAYFREIIQQLDEREELENMRCYVFSDVGRDVLNSYLDNRNEAVDDLKTECKGDGRHYQIWEYIDASKDAGSKAPKDIRTILCTMGYEPVCVHMDCCMYETDSSTKLNWIEKRSSDEWRKCVEIIRPGSILALQHPFRVENRYRDQALLDLKKKGVRMISLVHDVEMIRGLNCSDYFEKETNFMMDIADVIIVQNNRMKAFFQKRWPSFERLVSLQVFDYMSDASDDGYSQYSDIIKFAGSLEYRKSPFLYKLGELRDLKIQLYGPDFEVDRYDMGRCPDNIEYCGAFAPEELPWELKKGFGLVWDGDLLDNCGEGTGRYLEYNSPHKLSLYLASGLPVIVWDRAATADFVKKNNVGLTINSLYGLEDRLKSVTPEQYKLYAKSVREVGKKLREGYYTKTAIREAEKMIHGNFRKID